MKETLHLGVGVFHLHMGAGKDLGSLFSLSYNLHSTGLPILVMAFLSVLYVNLRKSNVTVVAAKLIFVLLNGEVVECPCFQIFSFRNHSEKRQFSSLLVQSFLNCSGRDISEKVHLL